MKYASGEGCNNSAGQNDSPSPKQALARPTGSYFLGRNNVQHIYGLLTSGGLKKACDSLPDVYTRYNEDHMFYAMSKHSFGGEVKHINYDLVVSNPLFLEFISDYYVLHFYSAKDLMLKVADKILQNTGLFFSKP